MSRLRGIGEGRDLRPSHLEVRSHGNLPKAVFGMGRKPLGEGEDTPKIHANALI